MPNFDQTGPWGRGLLTGRGFGSCYGSFGYKPRALSSQEYLAALNQEEKDLQASLKLVRQEKAALKKK
ncbi:MAG: hypothetical protein COU22_00950 [Candidatus Komeilibacteria bacterium CG10_big_fil_rev_8_21_14_0_10_41_13]|uniref:DUF5320 domain-containing protein n=1 Tax=Candidatus Komeilibacteria bacterium CG10_big_fil_rev_8_21_14_0_10_41_13 TaxID=1974476 RepID=A0A2M6WD33_9BACT|nr:MAG: hypothetical protein COU22_00950 [Candidatus Komeilibacteria bacterium CG10_big_fil_rev_8_21_14_0_10_41_13]